MVRLAGVSEKQVPPIRISGVRWFGRVDDAPARFAALRERVGSLIAGPALLLVHGDSPVLGRDLEAAYPVSEAAEKAGVSTRVLDGGNVLAVQHDGVFAPPEAPDSWQTRMAAIRDEVFDRWFFGNGPRRTVYLDAGGELRPLTERQRVEVQFSLGFGAWADGLARGVEEEAGLDARKRVLEGAACPAEDAPAAQRAAWVREAVDRLDRAVPDGKARCAILGRCSHRSPDARNDEMRRIYQESASIDVLLAHMMQDKTAGGTSWFEHPQRVGNVIYITKIPYDPEGFLKAKTPLERRISYCHCTFVREAFRAGEAMSPTFCGCGLGWFPPIWESILGVPVRVEHVRSLLTGSDSCQVAIHLPESLVWRGAKLPSEPSDL